jgi:hypothetical protein
MQAGEIGANMAACGPIWFVLFTAIVGAAGLDLLRRRPLGFLAADDFAGYLSNNCLRRHGSD